LKRVAVKLSNFSKGIVKYASVTS